MEVRIEFSCRGVRSGGLSYFFVGDRLSILDRCWWALWKVISVIVMAFPALLSGRWEFWYGDAVGERMVVSDGSRQGYQCWDVYLRTTPSFNEKYRGVKNNGVLACLVEWIEEWKEMKS